MNVIREEEQSFLRTLDQGLQLLENVISDTEGKTVLGSKAFELYDTFGFPIDLTALILRERNYELDEQGFERAMFEQKTRSRRVRSFYRRLDDFGRRQYRGFCRLRFARQ
jgi:alanyl-tRNA synthetase